MDKAAFTGIQRDLGAQVQKKLEGKRKEYADDVDVLANFTQAAHLQQTTAPRALLGMMAKHTVSVFEMVHGDEAFTIEQWDEKITDHIAYLILLKATLIENAKPIKKGK